MNRLHQKKNNPYTIFAESVSLPTTAKESSEEAIRDNATTSSDEDKLNLISKRDKNSFFQTFSFADQYNPDKFKEKISNSNDQTHMDSLDYVYFRNNDNSCDTDITSEIPIRFNDDDGDDDNKRHIENESIRETLLDSLIHSFHCVWFVSTMGTGITGSVLYNFPIEEIRFVTKYIGLIFFFINLILILITNSIFILKYTVYRKGSNNNNNINKSGSENSIIKLLYNPSECVFLGCQVMGMGTIIVFLHSVKGSEWFIFLYILWWFNVICTLFSAWIITYIFYAKISIPSNELNAIILLPVVPLTVAATAGSLVTQDLPINDLGWKLSTNLISYLLWANSVFFAVPYLAVYFNKLLVFGLPQRNAVFSCFVPIGIMGQGSYGILNMGENLIDLLYRYNERIGSDDDANDSFNLIKVLLSLSINHGGTATKISKLTADSLNTITILIKTASICTSLFLVSMGVCLTVISILSIFHYGPIHKFSKFWWAMTFPMGTMSVSNLQIYKETGMSGFKIVSLIYAIALIIITSTCLIGSAIKEFPHFIWPLIFMKKKKKLDIRHTV
ncbi:unnamed protein product [[Candida] boidinii]|uniref:Unnamed protein product n=1 Tax=Candida boidinii TaxID=5477 RepID=A0A9W6T200_CANBO|nr:hypothetical protein B5S30_g2084 [[Candida] boidinii]GME72141.1 unnamed protein product [[Candida] boidinii]GMF97741.1 unnamed protein product [[Candida] boidinii]